MDKKEKILAQVGAAIDRCRNGINSANYEILIRCYDDGNGTKIWQKGDTTPMPYMSDDGLINQ